MNTIAAFAHEFDRYRGMIERALDGLADDDFFRRPSAEVNSLALVIKHLTGNLSSRWTDFLTSDGEKPNRDRDQEFVLGVADTRASLMARWREAWSVVEGALSSLNDSDLDRLVTIRGEPHSVFQALLRSANHLAYHAGQVTYLARLFRPDAPWITIAPGKSREHSAGSYLIQDASGR
ncbi:MAG: DUF1572 domain-containing protein [Pirellulales bacterium]|nr:DUF1572 domain-containing protein [Pirellulales bacterium]